MDLAKWLRVGDLMEMEYEGAYASTKVNDVKGNTFIVDFMTVRGRPVHIRIGDRQTMIKKSLQGLFFFEAVYEERIKIDTGVFFMRFRAVTEPVKNQRRQSFRVPVRAQAEVLFINRYFDEIILSSTKAVGPRPQDLKKQWTNTTLRDLSEEGLLIHLPEPYEIGSHIFVRFAIDDQEMFANAVVKRHAYSSINALEPDMIGVQMLNLDETTLRFIRKFLMNYQIALRQKELERQGEFTAPNE